jgi:hypothetical protein
MYGPPSGGGASAPDGSLSGRPPMRHYTASPLFRAPRGTHLTAVIPDELAAQMDQVEQAARPPRARSRHLDT